MGVACKKSCIGIGACLGLGFIVLMIVGISENLRFQPFYSSVMCSEVPLAIPMTKFRLPPQMLPPGSPQVPPPYGLFGSILNTTSQCQNPNQYTIRTKTHGFESTLYVPDLSTWKWGESEKLLSSGKVNGSYLVVASNLLKEDSIFEAEGTGTSVLETTANTTIDKFLGLFGALHLTGYAPLYTKTVATTESCLHLFGTEFCGEKKETTWCGALAGNCQTQVDMGGMKLWVPGLCAYTNTVCRLGGEAGEKEMKSLVTAKHLNLTTIDFPCSSQTGLPPTMNCPIAQAKGINATLHQREVPGFVDGPHPSQKDLQEGYYAIETATHVVILISAVAILCSFAPAVIAIKVWKVDPWLAAYRAAHQQSGSTLPSILTSQPESTEKDSKTQEGAAV